MNNKKTINKLAVAALFAMSPVTHAASVWTLTGITDSTNGDTWSLHLVSTTNSLQPEYVTMSYLDNHSDGLVDVNMLLNNPTTYVTALFAGSTLDMGGNYSIYDPIGVGGTPIDSETVGSASLTTYYPLYDSAFYSYIMIETYPPNLLGYGRIYQDHYAEWYITDRTARLTATTAVPVPAAAWLFGSGLLGLAGAVRRKRN